MVGADADADVDVGVVAVVAVDADVYVLRVLLSPLFFFYCNALLRKASCVVGRDVEVHVHIVVENVVECVYMHAYVDILGCMYAC